MARRWSTYHYLPPARYSQLETALREHLSGAWDYERVPRYAGSSWTTDAPFRETARAIAAAHAEGIAAVEMEAAASSAPVRVYYASVRPRAVSYFGDAVINEPDLAPLAAVLVGTAPPEIVALEARLRAAQLAANTDELSALIADELLFTGPDGNLGTKAQDLEAYAMGSVRFRSHEPEELHVRSVGSDVVVTALRTRLAVDVGGVLSQGVYRYTRVWAREAGGTWRVVGGHVSQVPDTAQQG